MQKRTALLAVPLDSKLTPGGNDDLADHGEEKGKAYRALFESATTADLGLLTRDPDLSLGLQAGWEEVRKDIHSLKASDASSKGMAVDAFLTFFTDRVGYEPPKWWVETVRSTWGISREHTALPLTGPPEMASGKQAGITRKDEGDSTVFSDDTHTLWLSNFRQWRSVYTIFDGDRAYLGEYGSVVSYPFRVECYKLSTGKLVWAQLAWGSFRGGFGGFGFNSISMALHGKELAMFGLGYAEGLNIADGSPRYRFCDNYWMNDPEKWHVAWSSGP